jgi:hypothetical protein
MEISLTQVGLFCLGVYLVLVGLAATKFKVTGKVAPILAFIAGVCILIGLFVTDVLVLK